jgi:hypothetical protein
MPNSISDVYKVLATGTTSVVPMRAALASRILVAGLFKPS